MEASAVCICPVCNRIYPAACEDCGVPLEAHPIEPDPLRAFVERIRAHYPDTTSLGREARRALQS